jgi:hypothetical protein
MLRRLESRRPAAHCFDDIVESPIGPGNAVIMIHPELATEEGAGPGLRSHRLVCLRVQDRHGTLTGSPPGRGGDAPRGGPGGRARFRCSRLRRLGRREARPEPPVGAAIHDPWAARHSVPAVVHSAGDQPPRRGALRLAGRHTGPGYRGSPPLSPLRCGVRGGLRGGQRGATGVAPLSALYALGLPLHCLRLHGKWHYARLDAALDLGEEAPRHTFLARFAHVLASIGPAHYSEMTPGWPGPAGMLPVPGKSVSRSSL